MTKNEFVACCETHGVAPSVALEHPGLVEALGERDDAEVERILKEEF